MKLFSKALTKFLALFLTSILLLSIATPTFARCCPPRHYRCHPPRHYSHHYYYRGGCYSGNSAACALGGFAAGLVVGSVIANNKNCATQRQTNTVTTVTTTVTTTETLPLIFHRF